MRIKLLLTSIILLCSFESFQWFKSKPKKYDDLAREIRGQVGGRLAKRHHMDFVGVVGGMYQTVNIVGVHFMMYRPMDIDEARRLIVNCTEEMLKAFNENEEIRSHLKNFPFTPKNLDMAIFSLSPQGKRYHDPLITVVSVCEKHVICYRTREENRQYGYKNEIYEPYEEALEKVKEGVNKIEQDRNAKFP